MTNPRLNDLQLILLATAVQRDDGSVLPPPDNLGGQGARIRKAMPMLLRRKLIEELPVTDRSHAWREQEQQPIGLFVTAAGRAIIAAKEDEPAPPNENAVDGNKPTATNSESSGPSPRLDTKAAIVQKLLSRTKGATLAELMDATAWQIHSTRAFMTGLRKKGIALVRECRPNGGTCWRIER